MQLYKRLVIISLIFLASTVSADGDFYSDEYLDSLSANKSSTQIHVDVSRAPSVVYPGKLQTVAVSNTDVNLIKCQQGVITDRTFSEEKPLIYKDSDGGDGSASFVKFQKQIVNGEELLYTKPVELYLTCAGQIFSLMLIPEAIATQHIILSGGKTNAMEANISMFKELDLEDASITLIDRVQFDVTVPETFSLSMADPNERWIPVIPSVKARLVKSIKPEGLGLVLHEYLVYSEVDHQLNEFDFVKLRLNTFALRLSNLNIQANGTVRAFLVERLWR